MMPPCKAVGKLPIRMLAVAFVMNPERILVQMGADASM